jgi:peptidoglycan/LPS O-acetylase OafA/YrhL
MELIGAILIAGPLGYFVRPRTRALVAYLAIWAIIFPIQTVVVHSENPDDIQPLYFVFNALILGLGIGLNSLGARLRSRRIEGSATASNPT